MTDSTALPKDRIRDAASVVLLRREGAEPRLLMGQRGKGAAFMPSKFVFPGGAVDPDDAGLAAHAPLPAPLVARLSVAAPDGLAEGLALAAIRETWEETGLAISQAPPGPAPAALPPEWRSFFAAGHWPDPDALRFFFRAITPPGRPRRFDARFFLVDAEAAVTGDLDDFSRACDELSHLSWVSLHAARRLDLPFITEVVLAEIEARLDDPSARRPAPFFHHEDGRSFIDEI